MATRLQNLLGVLPLQNLSRRNNPTQQSNPMRRNLFGMDSPINTNLQNQVGIQPVQPMQPYQQEMQPLAPIREQMQSLAPVAQQTPNYFNQQMINTGLQSPFTSPVMQETAPMMSTQLPTYGTASMSVPVPEVLEQETPYQTGQAQLFETFFSGIGGQFGADLTQFTSADSPGGTQLEISELAQLAGFDIEGMEDWQKKAVYDQLRAAGIGAYAEQFANLEDQLRNAQELRTMQLTQAQESGTEAYKTLLGYAEDVSTAGLVSGREQARQQEASKTLEEALRGQLLGAEATYVNELDALLRDFTGTLQQDLFSIASDAVQADPSLGKYLRRGPGMLDPDINPTEMTDELQSAYQQVYNSYSMSQNQINDFYQTYVVPYLSEFGYYPTGRIFDDLVNQYLQDNTGQGTE